MANIRRTQPTKCNRSKIELYFAHFNGKKVKFFRVVSTPTDVTVTFEMANERYLMKMALIYESKKKFVKIATKTNICCHFGSNRHHSTFGNRATLYGFGNSTGLILSFQWKGHIQRIQKAIEQRKYKYVNINFHRNRSIKFYLFWHSMFHYNL